MIHGGDAGLREIVQDIAALLTQGRDDGQDAFHEAAAFGAVRSKAPLAIKNRGADGSFGRVVRRLNSLHANKRPQRGGQLENHLAHALGLGFATSSPLSKEGLDRLTNRRHVHRETRSLQRPVPHPFPEGEHLVRFDQEGPTDLGRLATALRESDKIPDQVRPTNLSAPERIAGVGVPPIRRENAPERAQEGPGRVRAAVQMDLEDGNPRRDGGPKPSATSALGPSRLVGSQGRLMLDVLMSVLNGSGQGPADFLLGRRDGAQGQRDSEEILQGLLNGALGKVESPAEVADERLKGGADHLRGNPRRELRSGRTGALGTDQAMQQVLDNDGLNRRNLGDLVTLRVWIIAGESMTAPHASLRLDGDNLVHLFHGNQLERAALVAGLASRRATTRRLGRARGSRERVARRRLRGIPGVLVEASFQVQDPLVLLVDPPLKQSKLVRLRLQRGLEGGDDLPARSMNLTLGFPRLHIQMKHGTTEKDSSEVNEIYELLGSGGAAEGRRLTT